MTHVAASDQVFFWALNVSAGMLRLGRHLNELRMLCARRRNPSPRLNASRSNDFTPLRALFGDEGSKLGRRVPLRHDVKGLETLGGFRPFKIRSQRGVELVDGRSRRAKRSRGCAIRESCTLASPRPVFFPHTRADGVIYPRPALKRDVPKSPFTPTGSASAHRRASHFK